MVRCTRDKAGNQRIFDRRGNKSSAGSQFDVFIEDFLIEIIEISEAGIFTIVFDQP